MLVSVIGADAKYGYRENWIKLLVKAQKLSFSVPTVMGKFLPKAKQKKKNCAANAISLFNS